MKKGFTLIELLAVIVILAIIALIVTPVISDIIASARNAANQRSVEGHVKNIEYAIVQKGFENGDGDLSKYDDIVTDPAIRATLTIPTSDPITCESYKIKNGIVLEAKGCTDSTKNWSETHDYNNGGSDSGSSSSGSSTNSILNGTEPVLSSNLIPVIIENDGTVKKTDINTEWYNYSEKKWANAVILKDGTVSYNDNDTIPESNIQSYFVWIPKFKYKLFDMGEYTNYSGTSKPDNSIAHSIDIVFDTVNTIDSDTSCATPLTSGDTNNCSVGKYMTHPAFITMNVNGLWVGKFETSGSISDLQVKPNASILTNKTVGNFFTSIYNYKRDMDSHMMKNTEWGAVAYLSLSIYGQNDQVRINNGSSYTTGCGATTAAMNYTNRSQSDHSEGYYSGCENTYNSVIGQLASTTGNITGVYDMSGGAWEYMAAYVSGKPSNSGLTPSSYDSKYFDVYDASSSAVSYNYRILGDATGELGPFYNYSDNDGTQRLHGNWYSDYATFIDSTKSWVLRGGYYDSGLLAGQLGFGSYTGASNGNFASRIVLAPTES